MDEKLEVYDLEGNLLEIQGRKEFYVGSRNEFLANGKVTRQVKSVRVLLLNSDGKIYLQRRSNTKNENPGLYDKTVGGACICGTGVGYCAYQGVC